ncbi:MAG: M1 family aminopeptidase [Planctomycetota bacterium]|nr:M1 family aminopeptidase [Planctomycetota bacterium]
MYPLILAASFFLPQLNSAQEIETGVSARLAGERKKSLINVEYDLEMNLKKKGPITSKVTVRFNQSQTHLPLVLDFNVPQTHLKQVKSNGSLANYEFKHGHIVLPPNATIAGKNSITIDFIAGDQSLNRNEKFLYTLLVPDRASTVFPCFDQPDLKAKFRLKLSIPPDWVASANGALETREATDGEIRLIYRQTRPISTYLFAFAAGEFQSITREIDGRKMTLHHRETDQEKVERNIDDIFKIHALSLEWLEKYTNIKYPFHKFDFVLIPSFQYGGMEHAGNIFYNANSLFLEKSATQNQKLNRASLIAHETAHMWFGNLVTMKWFDDVWLKEVFANFMAAKIIHPSFPKINHNLGFMLKHHPGAYGEDRSRGTYPIQQKLDNLRNAGTLYGGIIYMKAPIVMRQLETIIGQSQLKQGLRKYLKQYSYSNAVWDDLIAILDQSTELDLKQWSEAWVKEPGTPEINSTLADNVLAIQQTKSTPENKYWAQQIDVTVVSNGTTAFKVRAMIDGKSTKIPIPVRKTDYDFYLANGSELGYGYFRLDNKSKSYLLDHVHEVQDDVIRGAAWLALYESLVRGEIKPIRYITTIQSGIATETEPLNRQNLLRQLATVYWKFLDTAERKAISQNIETLLWQRIDSGIQNEARSAYYKTLLNVSSSKATLQRLFRIWETESELNGLTLAETDFIQLACELAIRLPSQAKAILQEQQNRIKNEDRLKRYNFVLPALSPQLAARDLFFEKLKDAKNRRPERWTLEGLNYLHHPLRAKESEKYILPSLELLEEIQLTGDIFFPKRWLMATLSGHQSQSAANQVTTFLEQRPNYPDRLRNKILQAADLLLKVTKSPQ